MTAQETLKMIFDIIAALGSLATFGAFVYLFRRDKDKQAQIDKLTGILTVLDAQHDTMKKHNELVAQQVDIIRNTSILKANDQDSLNQLKAIEEKKLRLSVLPILWINGGGYNGSTGELKLDLNNKGETAILLELVNHSSDFTIQNLQRPYELDKGERRYIFGQQTGSKHIQDCIVDVDIVYTDRLGNKYLSSIKGQGIQIHIAETRELN